MAGNAGRGERGVTGTDGADRFAANTGGYARFRPAYPASLLDRLRDVVLAVSGAAALPVADIGSGTGIFTRQLADVLPGIAVICVEPSGPMREEALRAGRSRPGIRYVDGTAERLPFADASLRAVTAATAAHWFDLPVFLGEAARVLAPSGVLAIAEYVRDVERSPAAAALEAFLARHGGPKAYVRPDYSTVLAAAPGFADAGSFGEDVTVDLAAEEFVGLALSSSHARAVEERLGQDETRRRLAALAESLRENGGTIPYRYRFRICAARRSDRDLSAG